MTRQKLTKRKRNPISYSERLQEAKKKLKEAKEKLDNTKASVNSSLYDTLYTKYRNAREYLDELTYLE